LLHIHEREEGERKVQCNNKTHKKKFQHLLRGSSEEEAAFGPSPKSSPPLLVAQVRPDSISESNRQDLLAVSSSESLVSLTFHQHKQLLLPDSRDALTHGAHALAACN
jgi:hypothetical protein